MRSRVFGTLGVVVAVCIAFTSAAPAAVGTRKRVATASGYLIRHQNNNGSFGFSPGKGDIGVTTDAVMSLAAARRGRRAVRAAVKYLKRRVMAGKVTSIGLQAKVALAALAGDRNPRRFGGQNLIREIRDSEQPDGRYGVDTPVFHQGLAILAIDGARAPVSDQATTWLSEAQCVDGGWAFDNPPAPGDDEHCDDGSGSDFFTSDTNTTAIAVMALDAAGGTPTPADPFVFFSTIRDDIKGGWGSTWAFPITDTNSTALVLQAYAAAGLDPPRGSRRALRALQFRPCGRRHGAFAFTWVDSGDGDLKRDAPNTFATTGGIVGLLERPYPVSPPSDYRPAVVC